MVKDLENSKKRGRPSSNLIANTPFAINLARVLAELGVKNSAVESKHNLPNGTIRSVLTKGNPTIQTVWELEDALELPRGALCAPWMSPSSDASIIDEKQKEGTDKPLQYPPAIPFPAETRSAEGLVERQTRGLAAADDSHGTRVPDTDEVGDPYRFPPRLVLVPVIGESMSPVVLSRQYVFIDADREGFENNDGIYVVSILEPEPQDERLEPMVGTFVKRCQLEENMLYLKSINADYSPFSVYLEHCRLWPVLGTWYDDKGRPPEGF